MITYFNGISPKPIKKCDKDLKGLLENIKTTDKNFSRKVILLAKKHEANKLKIQGFLERRRTEQGNSWGNWLKDGSIWSKDNQKTIAELIRNDEGDIVLKEFQSQMMDCEKSDSAYKEEKSKCMGFIWGNWDYRCKDPNKCKEYGNVMLFDVDHLNFDYVKAQMETIISLPYVYFTFPSVSYHGIRIGVKTQNSSFETHKENYLKIVNQLETDLGISIDKQTNDPSRFFFYSYIPQKDIYINENSKPFCFDKVLEVDLFNKFSVIEKMLDSRKNKLQFVEGQRNSYCFSFFSKCCENGIPQGEAVKYIFDKHGDFGDDYNEIARKAYNGAIYNSFVARDGDAIVPVEQTKMPINEVSTQNEVPLQEKKQAYIRLADGTSDYSKTVNWLLTNFEFRRNSANFKIEYRNFGTNEIWTPVERNDLISDLLENGYKNVKDLMDVFLGSRRFFYDHNPFTSYFESLKHDGFDYIKQFCGFVETEGSLDFETHLKKAMCRAIAQVFGKLDFNKICLIFQGKADDGKTSLVRWLNPFGAEYHVDKFDPEEKDAQIRLASCFFINLDELADFISKGIISNKSKSTMSLTHSRIRFIYDKDDSIMRRNATFFATTETSDFLDNAYGNVRFVVIKLKQIHHDNGGKKGYTKLDINKMWAQAYHLFLTEGETFYNLTAAEKAQNNANNEYFQAESPELFLIEKNFVKADDGGIGMTATEIQFFLEKKYKEYNFKTSNGAIGRIMNKLAFPKKGKGNGKYQLNIIADNTGELITDRYDSI